MYELLLSIHLIAAVTWVGGSIAVTLIAARLDEADRMVFAPHLSWYGGRVLPAAAGVLLVAGIGLVLELDHVGFGDLWVILGIIGWIASAVLGAAVIGPLGDRLQVAQSPEEAATLYSRLLSASRMDTVIVLLVVVDMAVKPGV